MPLSISGDSPNFTNATLTTPTLTSPTLTSPTINSAPVPTVSGTAPIYGTRAWGRFNGTGTISTNQTITGSGNVTSVFKNATGNYTVTLTTAMADANFTVVCNANNGTTTSTTSALISSSVRVLTSSTFQIFTFPNDASASLGDADQINFIVIR